MKNFTDFIIILAVISGLASCVSIPKGAQPVTPFQEEKYLGQWYEIARLDFKFEKGLDHVTATYSLKNNGSIRVANKGYRPKTQKWAESVGTAKFVGPKTEGRLKVSFFGPFYAGYNVIAVDPGYRYALVAGNSLGYLWLLSREKTMPVDVQSSYLAKAKALGYDTKKLVWTTQD